MNLFINSLGTYVHIKDEMFEIKVRKGKNEIIKHHFSPKKITGIIINNGIAISSDAVKLAVKYNIDVLFVDWDGRPIGRIWHSKLGSTTAIRKAQLKASIGKQGLTTIKEWIDIKITNEIEFLKKLKKHRTNHSEYLDEKINKIKSIKNSLSDVDADNAQDASPTIRGLEGTASRLFYEALSYILPDNYKFNGRSSRPAKDQFNAFLNYAFGMLYGKIEKSLIISGLDPYLGYMHRDDYNQLSFVFDFIEQFRIYPIEVVFKLFSAKKVKKSHTDEINNGFSLNKEGKEILINAYDSFMDNEKIRHKGKNMSRSNIILFEARKYANLLIKETDDNEFNTKLDEIFEL